MPLFFVLRGSPPAIDGMLDLRSRAAAERAVFSVRFGVGFMPRRLFASLVLAAAVVAHADATSGRELFVDNIAGDDGNNGRFPTSSTEGGPVRTIGRALEAATPGDRINVAKTDEPYREQLSLSAAKHSGFNVSPLTIIGNGAVLDGTAPVPADGWEIVRKQLFRFRPPRGGYHRLFLAGKPAVQVPVDPATGRLPALEAEQWCSHDGFIYFATKDESLPRDYGLTYAALPTGITLYHVHDVVIVDLIVQGFQRDGVNAADGVRKCRLGGLTLRGNGRAGLVVGGSSQVGCHGLLVGDNGKSQVRVERWATLSLQDCNVLESAAPAIDRIGRLYVDGQKVE